MVHAMYVLLGAEVETFWGWLMKPVAIAGIVIACVVLAGAGVYWLLKGGPSPSASAPAGFTETNQTTQDDSTITTYSGAGTTQAADNAFRTWMEGQGWQHKMDKALFGGYTGHLYEKENEMAVVQATSPQAGQVTVVVVSFPKPSENPSPGGGPSEDY